MTSFDPAAARARCNAATRGPWDCDLDGYDLAVRAGSARIQWREVEGGTRLGKYPSSYMSTDIIYEQYVDDIDDEESVDGKQRMADAEFIAAARTGWPEALDVIEERDAEVAALRAALDRVTGAFAMAYKGPGLTDADCMREGATRLDGGYEVGGSNMRAATARLLRAAADELDRAAAIFLDPADPSHCPRCARPLPHNETEQAACGRQR